MFTNFETRKSNFDTSFVTDKRLAINFTKVYE